MNWQTKIRVIANARGMPLTILARRAEVDYQNFLRWMRKAPIGQPDVHEAGRLAAVLAVPIDTLFNESTPLPSEVCIPLSPDQVFAAESAAALAIDEKRGPGGKAPPRSGKAAG